MAQVSKSSFFEKLSRISLYLLVFLLPLWFLPFTQDVLAYQKQALLLALVFLGIISWLARNIALGEINIRINWLYAPIGFFLAVFGASTIFSLSRYGSFWGWPMDVGDSFLTFLGFSLLCFLIINTVRDSKQLFSVIFLFLISGVLAGIIALLQLYKVFLFPFDFTKFVSFNTIGSTVNSVAMLSSVLLPLALILAFVSKVLLRILLFGIVGILFLAIAFINFSSAWIVLTAGLLVLLAFGLWNLRKRQEFGWISFPMALLIIALFFLIFKISLPGTPSIPAEVSPSRNAEMDIARGVLKGGAMVIGSGPGTFTLDYSKFHSALFNQTAFWGTRFSSGSSEVFDSVITKGILGVIALLTLMAGAVFLGVKKLAKPSEDSFAWMLNLGILASLVALIVAFFLYPSNFVLWLVFFVLLGALGVNLSPEIKKIPLASPSILAVGMSFAFLLILIFGLGLMFIGGQKYFAEVQYLKGARLSAQGQTDKAIEKILSAASINPSVDIYWRDLAQLYLAQVNQISANPNLSQEQKQQ
ncbi:MAG: hypothetical protein Q7K28_01350, partial [Candidatus Wildermuthbacteria bacterium]|nr:hypothetical protein [Candidatus Wildermuthbacteria bacterium]